MNEDSCILRVSILQSNALLSGVDARFEWLKAQTQKIENKEIDLLICPELFMTGYDVGDDILRFAESANGNFASRVKALAQNTQTAILYGYPEKYKTCIYNSAICISAKGEVLANHRKSVLPPGFETKYFQTGSTLTLFTLNSIKVAILICYESEFPEAVRNVSRLGAQVVLVPTAIVKKWDQVPYKIIPTRAFENGVYIVYANHCGHENKSEYLGASCIVDPMGRDLSRAGESEQTLIARLDMSHVDIARSRLPYLKDNKQIPNSL